MSSTLPTPQLSPLARTMFPGAQEKINQGMCPQCGAKIDPGKFTDGLSALEYSKSGLCQACQDKVFGADEK